MTYFAHSNAKDKSEWQPVKDHLLQTSQIAYAIGCNADVSNLARIAALLHDIGKYSLSFQHRLMGSPQIVDHSTAGAKEAHHIFCSSPAQQYIGTLLAYCIAGHHSGLPDYGSPIDLAQDNTLCARLKKDVDDYSAYASEIHISSADLPAQLHIQPIPKYIGFSMSFLTRMVYSALVDADYLDTETVMNNKVKSRGGYPDIATLCNTYNHFLEEFNNPSSLINQKRTAILASCIEHAADTPGYFTLTVPTGGGKTHASMAFALNHARIHNLKRVIYVIPYMNIIEQNAAVFKKRLDEKNVLEHHSNFDWEALKQKAGTYSPDDTDTSDADKLRWASENWDIPIIITTNVQFFESLFANRSSRCRKIHNIAQSVIIFDEAQMLPRDFLKPCLYTIAELIRNYQATAVFCTATQPAIEQFLPAGVHIKELAPDPPALYQFFRRVRVCNAGTLSDDELSHRLDEQRQALCIVNTRSHARELFNKLKFEGRFHLSTLMCPVHRQKVVAEIRERLKQEQSCRVVSTQIMEAGIDVDFPIGYRALAGLDSIIQAAGRVNREMKQGEGYLWVFEPDSSFVGRVPTSIAQCADVARAILSQYANDPISIEAVQAYYQQLYSLQSDRAFDSRGILDLFPADGEPKFRFETAAKEFRLIDENTVAVIIPYDDEAMALLNQLRYSEFPRSILRALQRYTVNIYESEFQRLQIAGGIDWINETYATLNNMQLYDRETGLVVPENDGTGIFV
ncbi:MAG: CRISPR-associated helicase Cas3' [Chloroflexi bacterium]|nr:CRISPR-associated helicase Cas3' [Chloroflexota bacterium]